MLRCAIGKGVAADLLNNKRGCLGMHLVQHGKTKASYKRQRSACQRNHKECTTRKKNLHGSFAFFSSILEMCYLDWKNLKGHGKGDRVHPGAPPFFTSFSRIVEIAMKALVFPQKMYRSRHLHSERSLPIFETFPAILPD